jgi:hypothetical protein
MAVTLVMKTAVHAQEPKALVEQVQTGRIRVVVQEELAAALQRAQQRLGDEGYRISVDSVIVDACFVRV